MTTADRISDRADETPRWRWRGVGPAVAVVALGGGIILRFVADSPLWLDEALSVHIADGDVPLAEALRRDGHPALYYLVLGWWIDLFGSSAGATRALSGVFSLATVPFIWLLARPYGRTAAFSAGAVALTSPFLLRYGTETRMYAFVAFLVAIGWWATERAHQRSSLGRVGLVAICAAALVHTHYWTFFVLAGAVLVLAEVARRGEASVRRASIRTASAIALGAASLLIWIDVFLDQLAHTGTPWAERARPTEVLVETLQAIGGNNRFEGETLGILLLFLVLVGTLAPAVAVGRRLELSFAGSGPAHVEAAVLVITLAVGALAALATAGAFEARYAAVVLPFVMVLAGRGIAVLPDPARTVSLVLVVLLGLAVGVDEARRTRSQGEEVATAISHGARPGDMIVFCPDQIGPATTHYLDAPITVAAYPSGDGVTVDWRDYVDRIEATPPEEFARTQSDSAGDGDIWFVGSTGYLGFSNRCALMAGTFTSLRTPHSVVANSDVFESMFLIRYETR